jgi:tetratricopeptide (TPR) repeat protein
MGYALVISYDQVHPKFQIHNNDGTCAAFPWGTHLYSPWDPELGGYNGWHSWEETWNTRVSDMDWISCTGERRRYPDNPDGIFTVTIDKCKLAKPVYWAVHFGATGFWNYGGLSKYPEAWAPWSGDASDFETASIEPCPVRSIKEDALAELEALKVLTTNKHTLKEIDKTIEYIQKSLDPDLWVDGSRLDPKHGHKVFYEEKKAVKHLMKILKDKDETQAVKDEVLKVIGKLMKADELLAQTAIDDAKALGSTDPKVIHEIEKAEEELDKAKEKITEEHYDHAVDHFEKAWKHAQHAIKKAG